MSHRACYEPPRPPVAGPAGPPGPAATHVYQTTALGAVAAAQPVYAPATSDVVSVLDGSEASIANLVGFAQGAAADGAPVSVYTDGLVPLFSGLSQGVEHFIYGAGPPVPVGLVPPGSWYRSVGTALNPTTLLFKRGPVLGP